jgi:hypothetical protein
VGDSEDFWEEDARHEAEMEAAGEAHDDEIGRQWAKDNAWELAKDAYEENYEQAIQEFTAERLQSFYVTNPEVAVPAHNSFLYAQSLLSAFPQAALVFAVTATELTVKNVLLIPIISGLVHAEDLATFIADLTTKHSGMDRFHKLLAGIFEQYGGFKLISFKRQGSNKTLWEEMSIIQSARNGVIHKGENANLETATLSVSVADTLLNEIFPRILKTLGFHIHKPITVCRCTVRLTV